MQPEGQAEQPRTEDRDAGEEDEESTGVDAATVLAQQYGERTVTALKDLVGFVEEADTVIVSAGREAFMSDRLLQLAAEALVQRIGEAANRLPEGFRAAHREIPWRAVRGMRNVVARGYHVVDYSIVWETLSVQLPAIADDVRRILGR